MSPCIKLKSGGKKKVVEAVLFMMPSAALEKEGRLFSVGWAAMPVLCGVV